MKNDYFVLLLAIPPCLSPLSTIYLRGISEHKYLYNHVNLNKYWKEQINSNFMRVLTVNSGHAENSARIYL